MASVWFFSLIIITILADFNVFFLSDRNFLQFFYKVELSFGQIVCFWIDLSRPVVFKTFLAHWVRFCQRRLCFAIFFAVLFAIFLPVVSLWLPSTPGFIWTQYLVCVILCVHDEACFLELVLRSFFLAELALLLRSVLQCNSWSSWTPSYFHSRSMASETFSFRRLSAVDQPLFL